MPDITIADVVDQSLKLEHSNDANYSFKINDLQNEQDLSVDNVYVNEAIVMSSTKKCIDNYNNVLTRNKENKYDFTSACDPNSDSDCSIHLTLATKQSINDFNSAMLEKQIIEKEKMQKIKIIGDGNCLFRNFSYAMFGTQKKHKIIRKEIVNFVVDNWSDYKDMCIGMHSSFVSETGIFEFKSESDYFRFMSQSGRFRTDFEIIIFTILYGVRVAVFLEEYNIYKVMGTIDFDN